MDNIGNKTACIIRNVDWMKNPSRINYKITTEGEARLGDLSSVQEFGIRAELKYIRATVEVDRASDEIKNLSMSLLSNLLDEPLYLKV